jgi:hypothetical protein
MKAQLVGWFYGSDTALCTEVGHREGQVLVSSEQAGYLLYGPYMTLEPGRYRVVLTGESEYWTGEERADVACDKGKRKLLHADLGKKSRGVWHHIFELTLKETCTDLEIRVWVNNLSRIAISSLKVIASNSQQIGIVVVTYGILPINLVESIKSQFSVKWYIYHHGSHRLANGIREMFAGNNAELHLFCGNRGVGKSWNDGIAHSLLDGNIVTAVINDDVEFNDCGFDNWISYILESQSDGLFFTNGEEPQEDGSSIIRTQDFACYSLGLDAINRVGSFDEYFVPAYYEDVDYNIRCDKLGVSFVSDERVNCRHKRSSTLKNNAELAEQAPQFMNRNRKYMIEKWGADFDHIVVYNKPFNDDNNTIFIPFMGLI